MGEDSAIEWTDHTFNPWRGCTKVSEGCVHCYAEALAKRFPKIHGVWGPAGTRVVANQAKWDEVRRWQTKAKKTGTRVKVFAASMADIFEEYGWQMRNANEEPGWIYRPYSTARDTRDLVFSQLAPSPNWMPLFMSDVRKRFIREIEGSPNIDWIVPTKRPQNIPAVWTAGYQANLALLTSVENQETANKRIPELLKSRRFARVLGLSMEPLLGPVDISPWIRQLDWIIIGGESGPGARPCDMMWIRDIVAECLDKGVPVFVKQLGAKPVITYHNHAQVNPGYITDKKGGDITEWPGDLQVRQYPT